MNLARELNILVLGKPGSGKTTICEQLAEKFGFHSIGSGDYLRDLKSNPSPAGQYVSIFWSVEALIDIGLEYIVRELQFCLEGKKSFIIGPPKNIKEAQLRDGIHVMTGVFLDAVIELDLSDELCLERISTRVVGENQEVESKRFDDTPDIAKTRIFQHNQHIEEVRKYYQSQSHVEYRILDASKTPEENFQLVLSTLEELSQTPKRPADLPQSLVKQLSWVPEKFSNVFEPIKGLARAEMFMKALEQIRTENKRALFSQPILLSAKNATSLSDRDYVVIRKLTGGKRRLVYVLDGNLYLICKKHTITKLSSLRLTNKEAWNESLFDGILMIHPPPGFSEDSEWFPRLYLQDCLSANGTDVKDIPLPKRVEVFTEFLGFVKHSGGNSIRVYPMGYYKKTDTNLLVRSLSGYQVPELVQSKSLLETAKGLIYIPKNDHYKTGYCVLSLKWYLNAPNRLSLALYRENDTFALRYWSKNHLKTFCKLVPVAELDEIPDGTIVDTRWDVNTGDWIFIRRRPDKKAPDSEIIVSKSVIAFKNPLSIVDLERRCENVVVRSNRWTSAPRSGKNPPYKKAKHT